MKPKEIWVVVEDTQEKKQIPQLRSFLRALEDPDRFLVQVTDYGRADTALHRACHGANLLMFDLTPPLPSNAVGTADEIAESDERNCRLNIIRGIIDKIKDPRIKIVQFELDTGHHPSRIQLFSQPKILLPLVLFETNEPIQLVKFVELLLG